MKNNTVLENNEVGNIWMSKLCPKHINWKKIKFKNIEYILFISKDDNINGIHMLRIMESVVITCIELP